MDEPGDTMRGLAVRLAPGWRVRRLDTLAAEERAALRELGGDPSHAALAWPDRPGLGIRALDEAAAGWLERLREVATPIDGGDATAPSPREVAHLVLDGILELVRGGDAVSGPAAQAWLGAPGELAIGGDRLSLLSESALRLACELPDDEDVLEVSHWLYRFHRLPLCAAWERALDGGSLLDWLCARAGGDVTLPLARGYLPVPNDDWLAWRASDVSDDQRYAFKLYVSAMPEAMPEVAMTSLATFAEARVGHIKLAKALPGLLRPDKLIAYFDTREHLRDTAGALAARLRGLPAHGVPFSAALVDDGLLSWGEDPPVRPHVRGWRGRQSWRLWLTNRLARALAAARRAGLDAAAASRYARWRLSLDGVDAARWAPAEAP